MLLENFHFAISDFIIIIMFENNIFILLAAYLHPVIVILRLLKRIHRIEEKKHYTAPTPRHTDGETKTFKWHKTFDNKFYL